MVLTNAGIEAVLLVSHGMKNIHFRRDFSDEHFITSRWKRFDFGKNISLDAICLLRLPQGVS
jgi:hypothetical protein